MDELTTEKLAEVLHEPNVELLAQVLRVLGTDRTADLLAQTLTIEAAGGRLTTSRKRRRTPGGVFFQLVKEQASPPERRRLFPQPQASQQGQHQAPAQPSLPALTWAEVPAIIQTLATTPAGEARTMKVTLIGRPGKVETRQQCVVFRIQGKSAPALPKGLPPVPEGPPLTWTVMVALRQWNRVKDSVATNQDDALIIEGYPMLEGNTPVLLAQSCISMLQQRAQKQAPQEGASV